MDRRPNPNRTPDTGRLKAGKKIGGEGFLDRF